ncbi:hypothetical protein MACA111363_09255 [Macrococcoides canis]|uniref:Uncharacterized protein n=1 Tax=Macrococcoides canis TaxID=1855823 RepID=A0A0D6DR68_9STAP|nr:hypothetical protein [Macrococcus canis]ARQ05722.1 hypothetical protein MCCS_00500 [Macrococcus canis]CDO67642.1 hypothetical protein [Macrococcus canis]
MTHPSIWLRKVASQSPEVQKAFNDIIVPYCEYCWLNNGTSKFTLADFKKIDSFFNNLQPKHMRSLGILFSDFTKQYPHVFVYHEKNNQNHKIYSINSRNKLNP